MSRLEELINQHCPDGVEYKRLGDLGTFYGGITGKSKADFTDGNAKFISYMNVYSNPAVKQDCIDMVKIGADEKQRTLQYCDVCFTGSSETPDECGITSVVTDVPSEPLYLNSFCFFLRFDNPKLFNPHFLKHLFRDHELRRQICKTANGVTRFNVSKELMKGVEIPVPPLPVQEEIVRILDAFTELETELETKLETELKLRQKQYEYYRDKLLKLEECESKAFGDLFSVEMCRRIKKEETSSDGEIPFYQNGTLGKKAKLFLSRETYNKYKAISKMPRTGAVMLSTAGTIGRVFRYDGEEAYYQDSNIIWINNDEKVITNEFLSCYCRSFPWKVPSRGTLKHLHNYMIDDTPIPIPSINEQKRIVSILDRFEKYCNDISEGLPAEIKMRHQQYEYYRDKLLTFKRLEDKAV